MTTTTVFERPDKRMVVINAGDAIGSCIVTVTLDWVRLSGMYVFPMFRRMGHATRLMNEVIRQFGTAIRIRRPIYLEIDCLYLDELDGMNDAELRTFYMGFGFETVHGHDYAMVRMPSGNRPSTASGESGEPAAS